MTKKLGNLKLTAVAVFVLSLLLAVGRYFLLNNNLSFVNGVADIHYLIDFNVNTVLSVVVTSVVSLLCVFIAVFLVPKNAKVYDAADNDCKNEKQPAFLLFATSLCGFALAALAVYMIVVGLGFNISTDAGLVISVWNILFGLMAGLASAYFIFSAFITPGSSRMQNVSWLKIFVPAFAIYWLMYDFIGQNQFFLTSSVVIHVLGMLFLMLFFGAELQISADSNRTKSLVAYGLIATVLLITDCIPAITLQISNRMPLDSGFCLYIAEFIMAVYCAAKVSAVKSNVD